MAKTRDMRKTKAELVEELDDLRRQVTKLQKAVAQDKQAQEATTQKELLLHALMDGVPDHIYFKDSESRFIMVNKAMAEWFELGRPEDAVGKSDFDFFSDEHAREAYEDEQDIIRTGEPILNVEERETWPDGPDTWVSTSKMPLYDKEGNITGTFGISSDVTARKQAELALRDSEERLSTILNSMPTAVMLIDADTHTIIDANIAACDLAGADREQIVGSVCHRFICPAEQGRCPITDLGQEVDNSERVLLNAQGEPVPVLKTVTPIALGGRPCLLESFVDIHIRKQAEEALERRARHLQTVAEVSREASGTLDLDELIQQVVELVRERFNLYYAGLFLVDQTGEWSGEPGRWAMLRAGTGEAGRQMLEKEHKLEIGGDSMIGWCLAHKEARIALDVGLEAVRFENPFLPETRSELALPLVSRGEAIGALSIQSTQEAAFSEEDIAVLLIMAGQLANAMVNAGLLNALTREQYLMSALMDNVPDYIYFKDRESRFIRTTKAHARAFGLSDPAEVVGKSDFDFFTEKHARPAYEDEQRIVRTGEPMLNVEERETWPDRPDTWVLTSKMPLRDEAGNIVGTFGISTDITERRRTQEALGRRARQLQTVAEVSREATAILDVNQLLDRVVNLVSDGFGFYHAGIFLLDESRQYAVMRAASSEGGRRMLERGHSLPVGTVGIVGYVAASDEPRVVLDVSEDSTFFRSVDLPDTQSEAALPLTVRGQVVGVLDVQSVELGAFSEDDVAILRVLADQVAVAIENARLVERTEEQLRELTLLSGEYVAEAMSRLISERPLGFVYDRVDISPLEESPPAHRLAVEQGERITLNAPDSEGAVMAVPLKIRGQVIGSVGVEAGDGRGWSSEEIAVIEAVSEQVAQALESAQLFVEAQRSAQQMQALYETSRTISSSLEEETLMHSVLDSVQRTLGCELVLIASVDEELKTIGVRHSIWRGELGAFPAWVDVAPHPLSQPGLLADVYHTGRTEVIQEWDDRFDRKYWDEFDLGQYLRVLMPITLRDRALGVIDVVYSKRTKTSVSEDEKQMLAAFMDQTAVALENVRLFQQTRERAERERQIYDITTKLRRSPDIATILQTAVEELGQALRTDRAVVRLMAKPREE
jgi:PAS domain S-box-containing protein